MRRVVITGIGLVGMDKESFWAGVMQGKRGISKISLFETSKYLCKEAGEIKAIPNTKNRAYILLKKATEEALADSGLDKSSLAEKNVMLLIGTAHGSLIDWENWYRGIKNTLPSPLEALSNELSQYLTIKNKGITISTACTSSTIALGWGLIAIRNRIADVVIVGGVDVLSEFVFAGFYSLRALSYTSCKPFDRNRDGLVLGEGAGTVILQSIDCAEKQSIESYCELKGFATYSDVKYFTAPDFSGDGFYRCMVKELSDADVEPDEVSYINAHGTGTIYNDRAECIALKKLFQEKIFSIPISSIKPIIGHTSGACGVIEAALCALSIKRGFIPPTINFERAEEDFQFDFVPRKGRERKIDVAISLNAAFGGNNACVVFKRI